MPRNFICPETEEPCANQGCTRQNCDLERAAKAKPAQAALSPEEERIRRLAIPVAREIAFAYLKTKGFDKNRELVEAYSKNPTFVALARKRVAAGES